MMNGMDGMMGDGMMGGGLMILFMILWLIFLVAIIALIVWLVMRLFASQRGGERQQARGDSAEQILRERFARGEIDAEEYEHSLEVLRGKTSVESRRTDER